jgi:HK97 family phage prohead protease
MNIVRKIAASGGDGLEFVLSDGTVDRIGDVVEPAGWDYRDFLANPIALFGHSNDFPIGKWSDIRVEGGKLIAKLNLAARGTSARIDEMIGLVEQGILRAVSVGFRPLMSEPMDKEKPYRGKHYLKQELLECSLCAVPANPSALAIAKQLNVSPAVISMAFGEHAETRPGNLTTIGKHAVIKYPIERPKIMTNPSQRIEHTQHELNDRRDRLSELNDAETFDVDAAEKLNGEIDNLERAISVMKAAETRMGIAATTAMTVYSPPVVNATAVKAPFVNRRPLGQPDVNGLDLLARAGAIKLISHAMRVSPDVLMEKLFPNDEIVKTAFNITTKAASAPALTSVTGWAAELVASRLGEMTPTLMPMSVYGPLSAKGMRLTFGPYGTINIPVRSLSTTIAGSFVGEGLPIPVRQGLFTTAPLVPKKLAVISTWSREMDEHSMPAISALIREAIQQDTSVAVDTILLDATAKSAIRPAGIRNGISGQSATAGGGFTALVGDLKLLIGAVITATNSNLRNPVWIMNPAQKVSIGLVQPSGTAFLPFAAQVESNTLLGYPIITSGTVTAGMVIFMDAADYVSATDDSPRFEVSDSATLHMDDTTPLNIGTAGSPATVAAPSQSMFQTDCIALRMILPCDWLMRRASLAWVSSVTW